MKNLMLIALVLLSLTCTAQTNEIGLGAGTSIADRSFINYFKFTHTIKRLQVGLEVDMQATGNIADYIAPNAFVNAVFPVKFGYFYTGGFIGFAHGWDYHGGAYFGGHAGVNVNLLKRLAFNTEIGMRMIAGVQQQEYANLNGSTGSSKVFDINADLPITVGLRYRF